MFYHEFLARLNQSTVNITILIKRNTKNFQFDHLTLSFNRPFDAKDPILVIKLSCKSV